MGLDSVPGCLQYRLDKIPMRRQRLLGETRIRMLVHPWTVGGATCQQGPWEHAKPAKNPPEKSDRVKRTVDGTSNTEHCLYSSPNER